MTIHLILLGVQGSGKGTQAAILSEKYDLLHISTGDLFRALRTREDAFAKKIQTIMAAGNLVSDAETNAVLQDHLERTPQRSGIIFDGYPRNIAQAEWLDDYLQSQGQKLNGVLLMELDLYTAFKRTFGRVSSPDGTGYNIYYNQGEVAHQFVADEAKLFPPRLEATLTTTGEKLIRRPDDANTGAILKRIDDFANTTAQLAPYYEAKGLLVRIDAAQPIEAVTEQMIHAIDTRKNG